MPALPKISFTAFSPVNLYSGSNANIIDFWGRNKSWRNHTVAMNL
jgi:hypothetical protein